MGAEPGGTRSQLAASMLGAGELWPHIARFVWQPAHTLHPTRRLVLLPDWSESDWEGERALARVSRHLLMGRAAVPLECFASPGAARLALLPSIWLIPLAERMGAALTGRLAPEMAPATRIFLETRARCYWKAGDAVAAAPECAGWMALLEILKEFANVSELFLFKAPLTVENVPTGNDRRALFHLALRILREFDGPWSSLYANIRYV